ncbi:hypothetical protein FB107DRAFT_252810 [Schizophyllum commune]
MQARWEGWVRGMGSTRYDMSSLNLVLLLNVYTSTTSSSGPGDFRLVGKKNMNPVGLLPRGRTSRLRILDSIDYTRKACRCGLENAKLASIVPRSAPVPLGDRCDTGFWWAGGEERRGAPLRYPRLLGEGWRRREAPRAPTPPESFSALFQRPQKCEIDVKCAEVRAGASR